MKSLTTIKILSFAGLIMLLLVACSGGGDTSAGAGLAAQGAKNFTQLFARTVAHPRCVNCHAFSEGGQTARRHRNRSPNCAGCHAQEDFRASIADMTFTGRSASEICNVAVQRRGNSDAVATLLRTSPHVLWAIDDGSISSTSQQLRLAPPGNHAVWLALVDQWVAAGESCE